MAWLHRHRLWVLVLDGTERWSAFPRLAVFPGADGWAACVIEAPGRRTWVPGSFATDEEAKTAAIDAARQALSAEWLPALAAGPSLPAANDSEPRVFAPLPKLGYSS
jgi:hypothetical protein